MAVTMRAFVITGPGAAEVRDAADGRSPRAGEVVVDVERAGVCGTDVEFYTGEMAYLHTGQAAYPIRIGHEWAGTVASVGDGRGSVVGRAPRDRRHDARLRGLRAVRAAAASTCARTATRSASATAGRVRWPSSCRCRSGRWCRCPTRSGRRWAPWSSPAATRCAPSGRPGSAPGERLLVLGPGTIGLLVAADRGGRGHRGPPAGPQRAVADLRARARVREHVDARDAAGPARGTPSSTPPTSPGLPALALDLVEPGRRVVYIGLAGQPSLDRHAHDGAQGRDGRRRAQRVRRARGHRSTCTHRAPSTRARSSPRRSRSTRSPASSPADRRPGWGDAPKIHVDPRR